MTTSTRKTSRKARTIEQRERQLVDLAVELAEQQLIEGTASPSVITHYLKLASSREKLEQTRLANENELLKARVKALEAAERTEVMYKEAIEAIRSYAPTSED